MPCILPGDYMYDAVDEVADAVAILNDASAKLRALMEVAIRSQRYRQLAALAKIAAGVAALRDNSLFAEPSESMPRDVGHKATENRDGGGLVIDHAATAARGNSSFSAGRAKGRDYPFFKRDGERLVKVGWSKKDASEYEHKAPHAAVLAVCGALRSMKKNFAIEEMLPLKDADGVEVPSYHVYMVVAWLRQLGLVDRNGNDGYTARREHLGNEDVARIWHSLTER